MKILFVIAMEKEAKDLAQKLKLKEENGIFKNENISLIITGIGKQRTAINLTKFLENNPKPDLIINVGYVGSTNCKIGSWINVNNSYNYEWQILDEEKYELEGLNKRILEDLDYVKNLPCYSAESFVTETNIKNEVLFDMELHSVYVICQLYGIKLVSLKKVSDNLCLDEYYKNIERKDVMELTSCIELLKKNNLI